MQHLHEGRSLGQLVEAAPKLLPFGGSRRARSQLLQCLVFLFMMMWTSVEHYFLPMADRTIGDLLFMNVVILHQLSA